jgi:hypothetical protein
MLLIACGSWIILEDIFERIKNFFGTNDGDSEGEIQASLRAIAITIIVLASATHSLLHDIFADLVAQQGIFGTAKWLIYTFTLWVSCVLWAWIRGAKRQSPRAARYGLLCGAIITVVTAVVWLLRASQLPHPSNLVFRPNVSSMSQMLVTIGLLWILIAPGPLFGFLGGRVVDSGRFRRPTAAIAIVLAIGNFAWSAVASALFRTWIPWRLDYLLPIAAWWIAVALHPEIDRLLTVKKIETPV